MLSNSRISPCLQLSLKADLMKSCKALDKAGFMCVGTDYVAGEGTPAPSQVIDSLAIQEIEKAMWKKKKQ